MKVYSYVAPRVTCGPRVALDSLARQPNYYWRAFLLYKFLNCEERPLDLSILFVRLSVCLEQLGSYSADFYEI